MVPPLRLITPAPAVAVRVPPQLLVVLEGVAITKPAGRLSVNATPVKGLLDGFCRVIVSVEVAPATIGLGENPLVRPIDVTLSVDDPAATL